MAAGGMGPHAFTASCSFALLSFSRASGGARASDRATGCPWGVPWGRGARVDVRRVWGVGGVVPMATGLRIMFFCSGVFCKGFIMGKVFGSGCWLLLGSAMGPRCACRGEAGVGRGGAWFQWPQGGMGPRAFTALCSFALLSFARAPGGARASDRMTLAQGIY